jgi:hypothetical protein
MAGAKSTGEQWARTKAGFRKGLVFPEEVSIPLFCRLELTLENMTAGSVTVRVVLRNLLDEPLPCRLEWNLRVASAAHRWITVRDATGKNMCRHSGVLAKYVSDTFTLPPAGTRTVEFEGRRQGDEDWDVCGARLRTGEAYAIRADLLGLLSNEIIWVPPCSGADHAE